MSAAKGLRGYLGRWLGWTNTSAIDHALRSIDLARKHRAQLVLCGDGDLVPLAYGLHPSRPPPAAVRARLAVGDAERHAPRDTAARVLVVILWASRLHGPHLLPEPHGAARSDDAVSDGRGCAVTFPTARASQLVDRIDDRCAVGCRHCLMRPDGVRTGAKRARYACHPARSRCITRPCVVDVKSRRRALSKRRRGSPRSTQQPSARGSPGH